MMVAVAVAAEAAVGSGRRARAAGGVHGPEILRWACMETELGTFVGVATPRGICRLIMPTEFPALVEEWAIRRFPHGELRRDDAALAEAHGQLLRYLGGRLQAFDLPLDPQGTEFQRRVWAEVARIPYGETRTYRQIAAGIGSPQAVRAVGAANAANPLPIIVPCHRVIGTDGSLTGYGGGLALKQRLLELELGGQVSRGTRS